MKTKKIIKVSSFLLALGMVGCGTTERNVIENNGNNVDVPNPNNPSNNNTGEYQTNNNGGSSYADRDGSLSDAGWARMIKDSYEYCEKVVEEGSVLLKNDNNCLPITKTNPKVTLFGNGSANLYMRSGVGGPAANDELVVDLATAFERGGFNVNRSIYDSYPKQDARFLTSPDNNTRIESGASFYTQSMKDTFSEYNDAAIITFVRIGTENADPPEKSLDLTNKEKSLLSMVKESGKFNKIIVLINSPMPISMDWADKSEYGVDAIIYMGTPGYYGVGGVVNVISGKANPSGHLVDTFATSASSSPAYVNFNRNSGNSTEAFAVAYLEGIYVGYKYYETRYEDCVLGQGNANGNAGTFASVNNWDYGEEMGYPFGYGLSYTTFKQSIKKVNYVADADEYKVTVEVKNTGLVNGKASVQLYAQQPNSASRGIETPSIALMGYDKVEVKPGETKEVDISFPRYLLARYDYINAKTYILDGGDYYFAVGNGAHEALNNILSTKAPNKTLIDHLGKVVTGDTSAAHKVTIDFDGNKYSTSIYNDGIRVKNQFDDADYNYMVAKNGGTKVTYLSRTNWQNTWPTMITNIPAKSSDLDMSILYNPTEEEKSSYLAGDGINYNVALPERITFDDMADVPLEGTVKSGKFIGQNGAEVWQQFISQMSLDDLIISIVDNRGLLDVVKVMKKGNAIAEGPEGLLAKFKYGDFRWCTCFPGGPTYTGTWDHNMQKQYGGFYAEEAIFSGVAMANSIGANIVRTPYTSRANEYMSEDGILNYYTASNVVKEARRKGVIMNVRNCFLNSEESGRQGLQTYCNEQAIREIYLKPFEGVVTRGDGLGIITSYNRIGTVYAACNKALMQNVIRDEWNYKGIFTNSPLTGGNNVKYSNGPAMLYCGNDIFCLDGDRGRQIKDYITANDDGALLNSLQRANKYIMYTLLQSFMGGVRVNEDINPGNNNPGGNVTNPIEDPKFNPITDEIKALAASQTPELDPKTVIYPKNREYDYSDADYLAINIDNDDMSVRKYHTLIYLFEGTYTEGYQGSYNELYANLYLWDDGIFTGVSHNTKFKGFWYNDVDGNGVVDNSDTLGMVSQYTHFESISCTKTTGFYDWEAYMYLYPGWGDRSIIVSGYMYYETIALAVDTTKTGLDFKIGDSFRLSAWSVNRILQNLKYGAVYNMKDGPANMKIDWVLPDGLIVNNRFAKSGTYTLGVIWNGLSTSVTIYVAA